MSDTENLALNAPALSGLSHIVLFGKAHSGKTSAFRSLSKTIISGKDSGPNVGICELSHNEKAILIDTASLSCTDELEDPSMKRVRDIVRRADIAIYTVDIQKFDRAAYQRDLAWMKRNMVNHLLIFNKCDTAYAGDIARLKMEFPQSLFLSTHSPDSIALLRTRLFQLLHAYKKEPSLVPDNLVQAGDFVIFVVPDTNEQAIRNPEILTHEFLKRGVRCVTCHQADLEQTILDLPKLKLVVGYARAFENLSEIIPPHVRVTSYAFLFGQQKGDIYTFAVGAQAVSSLTESSRVLIAEGCHSDRIHRDIGRVKIPRSLRKAVGENLRIDYSVGLDLPENIGDYDLVIHCGGCSLSRRTMQARIAICKEQHVPIANFGTVLAELAGILDRCMEDLTK